MMDHRRLTSIILVVLFGLSFSLACQKLPSPSTADAGPSGPGEVESKYGPPVILGTITNPAITESSGLVASRLTAGVYWTHNDSGDGPFVYAIDERGQMIGTWRVARASADDWEDIAAGPGPDPGRPYLYVGDIGDNDATRKSIVVYRVPEPALSPAATTKANAILTEASEAIRLRYPDGPRDAEALLVHPTTGNIYIVAKIPFGEAPVYEAAAPLSTSGVTTLKRVATLHLRSLLGGGVTGGDISPDGRRVAFCDYGQAYELLLPAKASSFDDIWNEPLVPFDLGKRKQGEAIAYRRDGKAVLATSEHRSSPLIQVLLP